MTTPPTIPSIPGPADVGISPADCPPEAPYPAYNLPGTPCVVSDPCLEQFGQTLWTLQPCATTITVDVAPPLPATGIDLDTPLAVGVISFIIAAICILVRRL